VGCIELKSAHAALKTAYDDNLRDYKATIPQLFWFNGLIIISNGSESRAGSITATWEHFSEWKRINSEGEVGIVSLETMIRGTCEPTRLLDLVENFTTSPHWFTRQYLKLGGIYGKVGWNRLMRFVYRDRPAARRSLDVVLAQDFDRLVIAHGDIIEHGCKAALREGLAFLGDAQR